MWLIFNYNYAKIQHFFAKCNILCKKNTNFAHEIKKQIL